MKMIHCADLHLDSKMNANLDVVKAKERKGELLRTFERMVDFAAENGVSAILIAGDLFDTKNISATARNCVYGSIVAHPEIAFYYLKGNHDNDNFLSNLEEIPQNLKLFDQAWKHYEEGERIVISGIELSKENAISAYTSLVPDAGKINIIMLHGQESQSQSKDKAEVINLRELKNKGIDYLALGHIHMHKEGKLDARADYCYPGCLEGRGFDETGEHGFILLDIDETAGTIRHEFIPLAYRRIYEVGVDVSGCMSSVEMLQKIRESLKDVGCESSSLVKIILRGVVDVECEKNIEYLCSQLNPEYYFVKIYDETKFKINYEDYMLDESLKGEFVRQVMASDSLLDDEKTLYISYGLKALAGEEI